MIGPIQDITRPTGGTIAGFGHLLNNTSEFVFEVLHDSKYAVQDVYSGVQVSNAAANQGSWCIDEIPIGVANDAVFRFRMAFPAAPLRVQEVMALTIQDLQAGALRAKNVIRDYKSAQLSSGFAAIILGRRTAKTITMCVAFTSVDIMMTWSNVFNRVIFQPPSVLSNHVQSKIHDQIRLSLLQTLHNDFPDQLKITYQKETPLKEAQDLR